MLVALIGNQNSGKTTLFNRLTKSSQKVGNFPGVTIEVKKASLNDEVEIVDLPGTYSLAHISQDEEVSKTFINSKDIDLIINVIDATSLKRSLYLTCELMELGKPFIIALNMIDEIHKSGNDIDINELSKRFLTDVVPISASKNKNIESLKELIINRNISFKKRIIPYSFNDDKMQILANIQKSGININTYNELIQYMKENEQNRVVESFKRIENDCDLDEIFTKDRYEYINSFFESLYRNFPFQTKEQIRSKKIDKIVLHKFWAYPIFIGVIALVFLITFGKAGSFISQIFNYVLSFMADNISIILDEFNINPVIHSLVMEGIISGIFSVLSFLPTILLLFFLLSILEDSGYMARIAILMDHPFKKMNLSGKSFVPFILGFGCTVPSVMATRTLTDEKERKKIIYTAPFMSCSAKVPIYMMVCGVFFPKKAFLIITFLYLLGILLALFILFISKDNIHNNTSFLMELPPYRFPTAKNTLNLMKIKAEDFIKKTFTIIFVSSLTIWILKSFNTNFVYVSNIEESILCKISKMISLVFKPLGFGDWRITASLLTGITAKEAFVSTIGILFGGLENAKSSLALLLNPLSSYALLVFILLYTPCIASLATIRNETKSKFKTLAYSLIQTGFAWIISLTILEIGKLL